MWESPGNRSESRATKTVVISQREREVMMRGLEKRGFDLCDRHGRSRARHGERERDGDKVSDRVSVWIM